MFDPEDDEDLNEASDDLYKDLASQKETSENLRLQQRLDRFKVLIKKKTMLQKVICYKQTEAHQTSVIK